MKCHFNDQDVSHMASILWPMGMATIILQLVKVCPFVPLVENTVGNISYLPKPNHPFFWGLASSPPFAETSGPLSLPPCPGWICFSG